MMMMILWLIVAVVALRWLMASDHRGHLPAGTSPQAEAELARLREEVDRLSGQVERLLEEQSFLVRLLSEGEAPDRLPLPREDLETREDSQT